MDTANHFCIDFWRYIGWVEWVGEAHLFFVIGVVKNDPFLFYIYAIDNSLGLSKLD